MKPIKLALLLIPLLSLSLCCLYAYDSGGIFPYHPARDARPTPTPEPIIEAQPTPEPFQLAHDPLPDPIVTPEPIIVPPSEEPLQPMSQDDAMKERIDPMICDIA